MASAAGVRPVPVSADESTPPGEAVTFSVAFLGPAEVGAKRTLIVHEPPPGTAAVQPLLLMVNCPASRPPRVTMGTPLGDWPLFDRVKSKAPLSVPLVTLP